MPNEEVVHTPTPQDTVAAEDTAQTREHLEAVNTLPQKLPTFYTDDPEVWFLQAEAVFKADKVSSQTTRFYKTFGQLPRQVITQVADLAETPGDAPYNALKERLIKIYGSTKSQKIQEILNSTELENLQPTQLLRKMKFQLGTSTTEEVLKVLWTRALPTRVQTIIAPWNKESVEKLAEIADQVMDVPEAANISAITQKSTDNSHSILNLKEEIRTLNEKLDLLTQSKRRTEYNRRGNQQQSYRNNLCFYHNRWGKQARNCCQPCNWQRVSNSQIQKN